MYGATGRHLGDVTLGVPARRRHRRPHHEALGARRRSSRMPPAAGVRTCGSVPRSCPCTRTPTACGPCWPTGRSSRATCSWRPTGCARACGVRSTRRAPQARYVGLTNFGGITRGTRLGDGLTPQAWHFVFGRRSFFGAHPLPTGDVVWFVNVPRAEIGREERADDHRRSSGWRGSASSSRDDAGPAPALVAAGSSSSPGTTPTTCRTCPPGGAGAPCSSGTPHTRRRRARPGCGDGARGRRRARPVGGGARAAGLAALRAGAAHAGRGDRQGGRAQQQREDPGPARAGAARDDAEPAVPLRGGRALDDGFTAHRLGADPTSRPVAEPRARSGLRAGR